MKKTFLNSFDFKKPATIGAASLLLLGLAACSPEAGTASGSANAGADSNAEAVVLGDELTLIGGWAKATDSMSGVFGTLENPGDEEIALIDASSSVASMVELHETVVSSGNMTMQEIEGGFVIPAGGTYELSPGGDHIMIMGLKRELLAGEQLDLELVFSDGSTKDLLIEIRDFAGAIEEYAPGDHDEHAEHGEHAEHQDHDDHDDH